MIELAGSRLRRRAICTAAVVLGAGLVTVPAAARQASSPGAAQPLRATQLSGFAAGHTAVRVGGEIWDSATVLPRGVRAVTVQYRRAGTKRFTTASTTSTSAIGAVRLGLQPPAAGTWQFRAVVAATPSATRLVSPTRTITASGRAAVTRVSGLTGAGATIRLGQTVSNDVVVTPRTKRAVLVQARRPGSTRFVTLSTGASTRSGGFHAVYRPTSVGAWHFRLVVPANATARAMTSAERLITAVANPAAGDPPTTGTSTGTGTGTSGGGSTPGGGTPGDGTPGDGTPGGPAQPVVTTAGLAVRVPGYPTIAPNNKLTVDVPFAFDASASLAADGRTLESGRLDYGDGQSDTFTAPNGPLDYWNTLHAYTSTGSKTVTLTVTDSAGTTDTTTVTVSVFDAPTSSLQVSSGAARVGEPVTLALGATTPDGTQVRSYSLIVRGSDGFFLTDDNAPPATRDLTFTKPGQYTVSLRVENDANGSPDEATVAFDVAAAP